MVVLMTISMPVSMPLAGIAVFSGFEGVAGCCCHYCLMALPKGRSEGVKGP